MRKWLQQSRKEISYGLSLWFPVSNGDLYFLKIFFERTAVCLYSRMSRRCDSGGLTLQFIWHNNMSNHIFSRFMLSTRIWFLTSQTFSVTNSVVIMLFGIILGYVRSLIRPHLKWFPILPIRIEPSLNFVFHNGKVRLTLQTTFLGSWEHCSLLTWGLVTNSKYSRIKHETKYPRNF